MARVAVIGGGWAGLASAHALFRAGHQATVFETGPQLGGRARSLPAAITEREGFTLALENGQHLLLGAYHQIAQWLEERQLALDDHFLRTPLTWQVAPDHLLLRTPPLPAPWHGLLALVRAQGWRWPTRFRVLNGLRQLKQRHWQCPADWSWQHCLDVLGQDAPSRDTWWYPLCLAVANTDPAQTQAQGLLNVLRTVFEGPAHYSDLWFPKSSLSELADALLDPEVERRLRHTVRQVTALPRGFLVDEERYDALVLAAPPVISARFLAQLGLLADAGARWPEMPFHSITTCYLKLAAPYRLRHPMVGLLADPQHPAGSCEARAELAPAQAGSNYPAWGQWVFDRGQIVGQTLEQAELAVVISQAHTMHGFDAEALAHACWQQLKHSLDPQLPALHKHFVITDKRATFALTPELERPPTHTANPRVVLAGDWVAGPYPATLEGAARAGFEAARQLNALGL